MKTKKLLTISVVSAGLAIAGAAQAHQGKHPEQTINKWDVPAAVQQAAKAEAKGTNIIRWEKEGGNYEAVINQNGKEMGITIKPNGKVLNKHNVAKEHQATATKY
jgi:hypothetical protein